MGSADGDRIAAAFRSHGKRAALMPYVMGGFPSLEESRAIGLACADSGADVIELGVPFSDPLADGPLIHAAATEALAAGATPRWVLEVASSIAERVPVVLMVYANVVLGHDAFLDQAAAAGVSGLIVPDLPHDESADLRAATDALGLALVPLAAPTSSDERLQEIGADARGVGELADGVIVGSRLVRAAGEGGADAVGAAVAGLADALAVA